MAYILTPLTDPDDINTAGSYASDEYDSTEVNIDPVAKTFQLKQAGNLSSVGSGVTGQALYSFFKDRWKNVTELPQYDFPMLSITNEQFEFINDWEPEDDTTRKMLRTCGWAEVDDASAVKREYSGVITLGTFVDNTDQPYFQQVDDFTTATTDTDFTGPVNEAVQVYGDASNGDFDYRGYFKMYVRVIGKSYDDADLVDIGVGTMTYIVYRFPLTNSTDLKWGSTVDADISSGATVPADISPFDNIEVDFLDKNIRGAYADATEYAVGDVVWDVGNSMSEGDGLDHWFECTATPGTSSGATVFADTVNTWTIFSAGEREISGAWYAFNIILDAENTIGDSGTPYTHSSGANNLEVYKWSQWALRRTTTIDETDTSRNGNVSDTLVSYVGDTLHTAASVFIDTLDSADANDIVFHDYTDTTASYPLTVTVTLNFNSNLSNDSDSVFFAYYDDPDGVGNGNEFGTTGALQVKMAGGQNVGQDISNNTPDGANGSSYNFSYEYDQDTTGGRTISTDTDIVLVALGLDSGQYVKATGTITNTGASVSLVAPLERNYSNPA